MKNGEEMYVKGRRKIERTLLEWKILGLKQENMMILGSKARKKNMMI